VQEQGLSAVPPKGSEAVQVGDQGKRLFGIIKTNSHKIGANILLR